MIDWTKMRNLDKTERAALLRCVDRAGKLVEREAALFFHEPDRLALLMDFEVTHSTCPLDFVALADAPDADFAHDLFGIYAHLNRETGELEDFFVPRFAVPE